MTINTGNSILYPTGTTKIVESQTITEGSSYDSPIIDMQLLEGIALQFNWSDGDDILATATLKASNDGNSFVQVSGSPTLLTDVTGTHVYDIFNFEYRFLRINITMSTGDSIFDIWANTRKLVRDT